jgi:hydroxymethylpyrimidine/phosphomethylpyrimidine kinase
MLVTPNLHEAARLLDEGVAADEVAMRRQGEALLRLGARAVLMKGGHASGPDSVDLLIEPSGVMRFTAPRIETRNTHGTGCTLSSAITAQLARGHTLPDAVSAAKGYLTAAISAAERLHIGSGHGPVHHFHALWDTIR